MKPKNKFQYDLVKTFLGFPFVTPKKLAKKWNIPLQEVLRVQATVNYEQYASDDTPLEDLMLNFFGAK